MKVAVYAICKNEEKFVNRWMTSMSEADGVYVLDTGSTDGTVAALRARGAQVTAETLSPWRFDVARNRSLECVPEDVDICVCTDLDEVFHAGWRAALERAWTEGTTQAAYRYTWSFESDGREGVVFWIEKAHARKGYKWVHPVHEVLARTDKTPARTVRAAGVQLDHFPDASKSRGQYLPLLELSVKEDPADDRNMHYLGREYMYRGEWEKCIATLKRHLALPSAVWRDERAASMRYIARACLKSGKKQEAREWYTRAVAEAPHLREPYVDFAAFLYEEGEWEGVIYFVGRALAIAVRPDVYICEATAWGSLPYDIRSIAYYRTGRKELALEDAKRAAELAPNDERLRGNARLIERQLKRETE